MPALKAVASQHPSLEALSQAQQHWAFALLLPPNVTATVIPTRRNELRNCKRPAIAQTGKVPALKAVASQHPSLEALSQAQQHWGFALLYPPNLIVTSSPSRRAELRK